jgi:hypothetical protein
MTDHPDLIKRLLILYRQRGVGDVEAIKEAADALELYELRRSEWVKTVEIMKVEIERLNKILGRRDQEIKDLNWEVSKRC